MVRKRDPLWEYAEDLKNGRFLCKFCQKEFSGGISSTVLKTGPDRPVRPVQPGTGSQSGPVNTPKAGQQPVKNRKTGQKPGKNRG